MTKKEHKKNYNMVSNPDSIWQRSSSARKVKGDQSKPSLGGKEIMQMLGIDNEETPEVDDVKPLNMMDIVLQTWNQDDHEEEDYEKYDHEEDYGEDEEEEENDD
jgi:hypothetical protein